MILLEVEEGITSSNGGEREQVAGSREVRSDQ